MDTKKSCYLVVYGEVYPHSDDFRDIAQKYDYTLVSSLEEAKRSAYVQLEECPNDPVTILKCDIDFLYLSVPTYKLASFENNYS